MFILGHTGITLQAARKLHRAVDLRVVALIALYPDIIDKTLHYVFCPLFAPDWDHGLTRTVGHSLTFNALVAVNILIWWWRDRELHPERWVYALVIPLHLFLDEMWGPNLRVTLLWPWLGHDFYRIDGGTVASHLHRNFSRMEVVLGEVLGAILLWDLRKDLLRGRPLAVEPAGAEHHDVSIAEQRDGKAPTQAPGIGGEPLEQGHDGAAHDGSAENARGLSGERAQTSDGHRENGGKHHGIKEADGEHRHLGDSP